MPRAKNYRYIKSRNEITEATRPQSQVKAIFYADAIAQITSYAWRQVFLRNRHRAADVAVFNGVVDAIDPRSGQRIRPCLITVRVARARFAELNLGTRPPGMLETPLRRRLEKPHRTGSRQTGD